MPPVARRIRLAAPLGKGVRLELNGANDEPQSFISPKRREMTTACATLLRPLGEASFALRIRAIQRLRIWVFPALEAAFLIQADCGAATASDTADPWLWNLQALTFLDNEAWGTLAWPSARTWILAAAA